MIFVFKSSTKNLLFKYNNFHEFCYYIRNFHFNNSIGIKMTLFRRTTFDKIKVQNLIEDIKKNL